MCKDQSGYITPAFSGLPNKWTKSEVAAKNPAFLAAQGEHPKKLSILSLNTWGDLFYQPLQMGHSDGYNSGVGPTRPPPPLVTKRS